MNTAHKIRMNPTPEQVDYLKRACGTRRFVYNWGREQWEKQYQAYKAEQETVSEAKRVLKPPTALALKSQFNAIRHEAYPWTGNVTKCVVEGSFDDLAKAYANFFAGRAEYPKYKKKGKSHESFYLSNDKFTIGSHWISIPGLGRFVEKDKATHPKKKRNQHKQVLCQSVKILGATVSCEAGKWYVSIQVDIKKERLPTPLPVVGVDVGIKQEEICSSPRAGFPRPNAVRAVGM